MAIDNDMASILLRLPKPVKERIETVAAAEHRSVTAQLNHWIESALLMHEFMASAPQRAPDRPPTT